MKCGRGTVLAIILVGSCATLSTTAMGAEPPGPVTNLSAEVKSYSKINLRWDGPGGAFHYNLYRATTQDFTPGPTNRIMQPAATEYQDRGLDPLTTYFYTITAATRDGIEGPPSPAVQGTTTAYSPEIHPRLAFFPGDIEDIRDRCKNGDPWKSWYAVVKREADKLYDTPPSTTHQIRRRMGWSLYSMTYLIEDSEHYFTKLRDYVLDCPMNLEGENDLSVGAGMHGLCFAYDIAYPRLSEEERDGIEKTIEFYGQHLSKHIDKHYSGWRGVAAAGLTAAALTLDKPEWVEQCVNAMEFALADLHVGTGIYKEGYGYSCNFWGASTHTVLMLKNAGVRDYYTDRRYMDVMTMRLRQRQPNFLGNGYEDTGILYSHRGFPDTMLNSPIPVETRQMKTIFDTTKRFNYGRYVLGEPEALLCSYYTDDVPGDPIAFSDWADIQGGLGYMGTGMGEDDLMVSFTAKPYAMTYAYGHQRPDDLSFEMMTYGAMLAHSPGYAGYAVDPYFEYAHNSYSHSTVVIAGESQEENIENTGLNSYLFSDVVSYMSGTNDNGYSRGAFERAIVLVRPTAGERAYFLLGDHVTLDDEEDSFTWYLHGGLSTDLEIAGRDATWNVPRWTTTDSRDDNVILQAHMAHPASASFEECHFFADGRDEYEYYSYVWPWSDRMHTKYAGTTLTASHDLLAVLSEKGHLGCPGHRGPPRRRRGERFRRGRHPERKHTQDRCRDYAQRAPHGLAERR